LWSLFILFNLLKPSGYSLALTTDVTFGNLNVVTERVYVFRNTPTARSENFRMLIPLAARSMAWVCGRSLAGIEGSNPARAMEIRLL
jgi:hypothetical protein